MGKKKQRKGRPRKNEAKEKRVNVESEHKVKWCTDPHEYAKDLIQENIQIQKLNETLEPLYPLMTSLEIRSPKPRQNAILETFNIQDYEDEIPGGYSYTIAFKTHRKNVFNLQVLISGIELRDEKSLQILQGDGRMIFEMSLLQGDLKLSGVVENPSKSLEMACQKKPEGVLISENSNYDFTLYFKKLGLQKEIASPALLCDRRMVLHWMDEEELIGLAYFGKSIGESELPLGVKRTANLKIELLHRGIVLRDIADCAFALHIFFSSHTTLRLKLHWGTLDGNMLVFAFREIELICKDSIPMIQFEISGIPLAGLCHSPQVVGKCFKMKYGSDAVIVFGMPRDRADALRPCPPHLVLQHLPEKLELLAIAIGVNDEGLKKRIKVWKDYQYYDGNILSATPPLCMVESLDDTLSNSIHSI